MAIDKVAAAYLAYFAYIDSALDVVRGSDFKRYLRDHVPPGDANGPWTLTWGPAANDGMVAFVARGADGTYGLAFRGTNTDADVLGSFQNYLEDVEGFYLVPWLYQSSEAPPRQISTGSNQALALAVAAVDPATGLGLLDYIRSLAQQGAIRLIVTGHSLGAALAVAVTAWLHDQVPKLGATPPTLLPHTFATPTTWDDGFAQWFGATFSYYAATNSNDIVPKAWADLPGIRASFPPPGPSLYDTDWTLYELIGFTEAAIPSFVEIAPSERDVFTATPAGGQSWFEEASTMHSMQNQYFRHVVGMDGPDLPNTSPTGQKARAATPA